MNVLLVEGNSADGELIGDILARGAPEIALETVPGLARARERLFQGGNPCLVLIESELPEGSGIELLREIRAGQLSLPAVMLVGEAQGERALAALQAGADDLVVKNDEGLDRLPSTLREAWARFLESSTRRSPPLRVLYAEPETAHRELVRQHFSRSFPHLHLTAAARPDELLERLWPAAGASMAFDLILLGVSAAAPMETLALLKTLRMEHGLAIPVVLLAPRGGEALAAQGLRLGASAYVVRYAGYVQELGPVLERAHREAQLLAERGRLRDAYARLDRLLAAASIVLYSLRLEKGRVIPTWVSGNIVGLMGYGVEQVLDPDWWVSHLHPEDREQALAKSSQVFDGRPVTHTYRFLDAAGRCHWITDELLAVNGQHGDGGEVMGMWRDITELKQGEQVQRVRLATLDKLVGHHPLPDILRDIAVGLEEIRPEMLVSILLKDLQTGTLRNGAAPSLPDFYNAAIEGSLPGEGRGSCGTAIARGEPVIVADIMNHPYWEDYREGAARAGLRACWSIPFKEEDGEVLGSFAIYYREVKTPSQADLDLIQEFAQMTCLAVRRVNADTRLRQAAAVFASTGEGVMITDLEPRILAVNRAYTEITGYAEGEVLGRNPSLLKSGRQQRDFYQAMWSTVRRTGHWQGEIWNRRKNGELYPQLLTISTVLDSAGAPTHYVGIMTDISQLKHSQDQLQRLAHYDPLTGLPNRILVQFRLQHALEHAERRRKGVAVVFIDLDRFKNVNDSLGHPAGDDLLHLVAQRMSKRLRDEDSLGRWGGDEFVLILEDLERPEDAIGIARELIRLLEPPFTLPGGHEVYVGASIGIALYPQDGRGVTELIQHADVAMYQAKAQGRNTYRFYTPALSQAAHERLALEAKLRRALSNGEFMLYYQPQIEIASGALIGCEALARWRDPKEGMIPPDRFIPIAEETGLIAGLGSWVLHTACAQAQAWRKAGLPPLVMSVNLSVRQLHQSELVESMAEVLASTGLPPELLKLELTESMIMDQGELAVSLLRRLKDLGVGLSIDDFGTGYSSLAYLKRFPIDELKIDQSFVRDIPEDRSDMEIAATIIAMARNLNLGVVAEGVETEAQLQFLSDQGCRAFQGYLVSPPLETQAFEALLRERSGAGKARGKV